MELRECAELAEPPPMEAADRILGQRVDRLSARRSGRARRAHVVDLSRVGQASAV